MMKADRWVFNCFPWAGEEQWEVFYSFASRRRLVQYDYRTPEGKLFSCCSRSLESARKYRDAWLEKQKQAA